MTKCVGITIETRPDYCLKRHLSDMLSYGCTRLEIGVQSVYEDVARDTNRWGESFSVKLSLAALWIVSAVLLRSMFWPVCLNTHLMWNGETFSTFPYLCGSVFVKLINHSDIMDFSVILCGLWLDKMELLVKFYFQFMFFFCIVHFSFFLLLNK